MRIEFPFFRRKPAAPQSPFIAPSRKQTGSDQETRVSQHFRGLGWVLLEKNYRCPLGEVDLIFREPSGRVVFMEVKFRSGSAYGGAIEALRPKQCDRIVRAALHYIKSRRLEKEDFRFDVAAVTPAGIDHIPNAFSAEGYTL